MCCTRPPHVPVATIFEISRYMYIRNGLLIRLLKPLRQPTTGFALLGAHQNIRLTETRGLRLPDEPQEGRNRSWAVEEVSATLSVVHYELYILFQASHESIHRYRTQLTCYDKSNNIQLEAVQETHAYISSAEQLEASISYYSKHMSHSDEIILVKIVCFVVAQLMSNNFLVIFTSNENTTKPALIVILGSA
ncbi:hypothetical protein CSKR_109674 [Clonorchis sinensis]|uniref:Uncharacterized protein n=1 Tax=Clonorchis sinensis TaxID=79923 RepID=A0A419PSZ7_CLOSI|nr:hypothetical protein CSKR_109674 [Clonorchis sinensis]